MAYNPFKVKFSLIGASTVLRIAIAAMNENGKVECVNCSSEFAGIDTWQIDHLTPQSYYRNRNLKVDNSVTNVCVLCPSCNVSKSSKPAEDFFDDEALERIADFHKRAENVSKEQIHTLARTWAPQSRQLAKKYKSGMFFRLFYS